MSESHLDITRLAQSPEFVEKLAAEIKRLVRDTSGEFYSFLRKVGLGDDETPVQEQGPRLFAEAVQRAADEEERNFFDLLQSKLSEQDAYTVGDNFARAVVVVCASLRGKMGELKIQGMKEPEAVLDRLVAAILRNWEALRLVLEGDASLGIGGNPDDQSTLERHGYSRLVEKMQQSAA